MELLVVSGEGLMRAAGRVAAAIGETHDVMVLSAMDFSLSATPASNVGILLMGSELVDPVTVDDPAWELQGIRWGTQDNRAWLAAMPVDDPEAVLTALQDELNEQSRTARQVRQAAGPFADPRTFRGPSFAARYLDPKLRVPAQTVAAGGFSFTPERMCWERQYTVGITDFLANGFDEWIESFAG